MSKNNFDINNIILSDVSSPLYPLKNHKINFNKVIKKNKDITFNEMQNICSSGKCTLCKGMPEDNKRCIFMDPLDDEELNMEFELPVDIIEDWSTVIIIKEEFKNESN